jgi:hypothetical protein
MLAEVCIVYHVVLGILLVVSEQVVVEDEVVRVEEGPPDLPLPVPYHPPFTPCRRRRGPLGSSPHNYVPVAHCTVSS